MDRAGAAPVTRLDLFVLLSPETTLAAGQAAEGVFTEHGYEPHLADWPGDRLTVAETREHGDDMADRGIDDVFAHLVELIKGLDQPPREESDQPYET